MCRVNMKSVLLYKYRDRLVIMSTQSLFLSFSNFLPSWMPLTAVQVSRSKRRQISRWWWWIFALTQQLRKLLRSIRHGNELRRQLSPPFASPQTHHRGAPSINQGPHSSCSSLRGRGTDRFWEAPCRQFHPARIPKARFMEGGIAIGVQPRSPILQFRVSRCVL